MEPIVGSRGQVVSVAGSPSAGFGVHGTVAERVNSSPKLLTWVKWVLIVPILVGQSTVTLGAGHQVTIDLPPNSLHLLTLDVESSHND